MKIEDCQTVNEFFGVEEDAYIWIEGEMFRVYKGFISGFDMSTEKDSKALVGCLTGQLKWSKTKPIDEFGRCVGCGYEFNSELISEYEIEYCPKCGQKIEEATEETIVPAMTAEEEKLLREIAAWFPHWKILKFYQSNITAISAWLTEPYPFDTKRSNSRAYTVLAPILEKYGEIDLDDYRESQSKYCRWTFKYATQEYETSCGLLVDKGAYVYTVCPKCHKEIEINSLKR